MQTIEGHRYLPHQQRNANSSPRRRVCIDNGETCLNQQLTTVQSEKAIASFFTPSSKKKREKVSWRIVNESLLLARYEPDTTSKTDPPPAKRRKIAAFDFVSGSNLLTSD